jgi:hypothetical protein
MGSSESEFTQEQADAILKRAIDLQVEQAAVKSDSSGSISMQQLYRSAAEIGIDTSLVRRAAEELAGRSVRRSKGDASASVVLERQFPVQVKESDFPDILEFLRSETKSPGAGQVIGGSLEWQGFIMSRFEMIHVAIVPSDGMTRVKIRSTSQFAMMRKVFRMFYFIAPLFVVMAFIPVFMFGFKYFSWGDLLPFVFLAAFVCLIPYSMGRFFGNRDRGNQTLMDSLSDWIDDLRASRG